MSFHFGFKIKKKELVENNSHNKQSEQKCLVNQIQYHNRM